MFLFSIVHIMSAYTSRSREGQRYIVDDDEDGDVGNTPLKVRRQSLTNDFEIVINVGGVRHETHASTLQNIPNTRLARLAENHLLGAGKEEYFFDRHPSVFNSIIDFYRTGELHVPLEVCGAVVKRELDFWQMNEHEIKACCWRHYRSYIENKRILDSFDQSLSKENFNVDLEDLTGWRYWQTKVWLILDHPRTSRLAMIYGIASFLFVTLSIAGFTLETIPQLKRTENLSARCNDEDSITTVITSHESLYYIDIVCTVFFTLELVVRFTFAPSKLKFVRSPMNIIDLLALVPLYVQIVFENSDKKACYMNERLVIEILFILRIIRMFRIFHLVKHYQALKVLVYAMKASLQELLMLFIFLMIGMLVFATMIYYTERKDAHHPSDIFNTIPVGFWWAIITMTTVGYGDLYPRSPIGYIVGTACSVCGVLLLALTFPVISNNFTLFYTHVRSRSQLPKVAESKLALNRKPSEIKHERPPSLASTVVEPYMNGNAGGKDSDKNGSLKGVVVSRLSPSGSVSDILVPNVDSSYSLQLNGSLRSLSEDTESYQADAHV